VGAPFTFSKTGSLATARIGHTTTLLSNGKVLVVGGWVPGYGTKTCSTSAAELYDPATGKWTATGSLAEGRAEHTATLLPDGKVLVAGGYGHNDVNLHTAFSAELYDPASGTWTATGDLAIPRRYFTATLLPNGKVIAVGGGYPNTAELYDPATGIWTATGSPALSRHFHTATLLANGKVLIAGGRGVHVAGIGGSERAPASAELYDPATETWTTTGNLIEGRMWHTATLLPNGKVLVVGGKGSDVYSRASVELYDPSNGTWANTFSHAAERENHTATLLQNGKVLVVGGANRGKLPTNAELYDPATGTWTTRGSLAYGRIHPMATLLHDGRVLVVGGSTKDKEWNYTTLASVELYGPSETLSEDGSPVPEPPTAPTAQ